jgi:hypothetical protein
MPQRQVQRGGYEMTVSLTDAVVAGMFDPTVDCILELVEQVVQRGGVWPDRLVLMGGFGGSPYLQMKVQSRFGEWHHGACSPCSPPHPAWLRSSAWQQCASRCNCHILLCLQAHNPDMHPPACAAGNSIAQIIFPPAGRGTVSVTDDTACQQEHKAPPSGSTWVRFDD